MEEAKKYLPEGIEYVENAYEACDQADAVVLLTEWNQYRALDLEKLKTIMKQPIFIDLRNVYEPEAMRELGFKYMGVGRG